jgi:phosphoglycolate phosphatase-like HAD superfamily hydrolase
MAARLLSGARALVFDFDGTLVDSNPIKWRAFERCFSEHAEHRGPIAAYCRTEPHTPRGDKFRHIYTAILRQPYTKEIDAMLHAQFERETTAAIIQAPEIPGAGRFLALAASRYVTALLSSTPQDTLLAIIEARGWRRWFSAVQGAPVDKAAWLMRFREERRLEGKEVILIGDMPEDARSARRAGCRFLGMGSAVPDFQELAA